MGTFGGILSTGQQALQAHQTALQVTGQNIANANTPGYSRERAELVSAQSSCYVNLQEKKKTLPLSGTLYH